MAESVQYGDTSNLVWGWGSRRRVWRKGRAVVEEARWPINIQSLRQTCCRNFGGVVVLAAEAVVVEKT